MFLTVKIDLYFNLIQAGGITLKNFQSLKELTVLIFLKWLSE